jgi:hypothetical protein
MKFSPAPEFVVQYLQRDETLTLPLTMLWWISPRFYDYEEPEIFRWFCLDQSHFSLIIFLPAAYKYFNVTHPVSWNRVP